MDEIDEVKNLDEEEWLIPYKCPLCNKEFYPTPKWAYKLRQRRYCSYHCFRQASGESQYAYRYKPVEQYTLDGEYIQTFKCVSQAADYVLGNNCSISDACRKNTRYKGYLWRYKEDAVSKV